MVPAGETANEIEVDLDSGLRSQFAPVKDQFAATQLPGAEGTRFGALVTPGGEIFELGEIFGKGQTAGQTDDGDGHFLAWPFGCSMVSFSFPKSKAWH